METGDARTGAGETKEPVTIRDQIGLLGGPQVLAGMAVFVFSVGGVYVFYAFIMPFLEQVAGLSALQASGALMAHGAMSASRTCCRAS